MSFISIWLRQRWRIAVIFALFSGVFAVSFALYRLPLAAVLYPTMLCALMGAAAAAFDYRRMRRRHDQLQRVGQLSAELVEALPAPQTVFDEDYQRIIRMLCDGRRTMETRMAERFDDMVNYYTVWAHQIKTPIAAMRLQLQNEDSSLGRALSSELLRIEQYVEMVMTYLRLDSDSTDYVFRECALDDVVRPAVRRFAGEFIARRLTLEYEPLNVCVITDEKWLGFVVEQVLSNALKYTQTGGVQIYLEKPCTLCIRDTGIGIAADALPRIFENGYTGANGRMDRRASGIGLSLCRRICNNLGHVITAESELDRGTIIRINLDQHRLEVE